MWLLEFVLRKSVSIVLSHFLLECQTVVSTPTDIGLRCSANTAPEFSRYHFSLIAACDRLEYGARIVTRAVVHNDELVWHIAKTQFNMKMLYSRSDAVFFVPRRNHDRKE
jgi:hypothetical protein